MPEKNRGGMEKNDIAKNTRKKWRTLIGLVHFFFRPIRIYTENARRITMRISSKRLNEIVDRTVRRILKEYGELGNYHVIWDFLERHTDRTVTKGAKRFSDLDDAYEYLAALMADMRGKFARTLAITQDGKIIYDASRGKMFKHNLKSQAEIERELRQKQEEDPTPYGSYRTPTGALKTPRQMPLS